jgi:hypothetical protein
MNGEKRRKLLLPIHCLTVLRQVTLASLTDGLKCHLAAFGKAEAGSKAFCYCRRDDRLPEVPLQEPTRRERPEWENELLGFPANGHSLKLHDVIAQTSPANKAHGSDALGELRRHEQQS